MVHSYDWRRGSLLTAKNGAISLTAQLDPTLGIEFNKIGGGIAGRVFHLSWLVPGLWFEWKYSELVKLRSFNSTDQWNLLHLDLIFFFCFWIIVGGR